MELGTATYVRIEVIAKLFGFESVRRVNQLVQDGVLEMQTVEENEKKVRRFDLIPTIQRYIKFLQNKAYGREQKKTTAEKEEAKLDAEILFKEAKAKKAQLELKELEGKMHRSEDVEAVTTDLSMAIRAAMLSLPGRLAVDLASMSNPQEVSIAIQKEVYLILDQLATYQYNPEIYKQRVTERHGFEVQDEDEDEKNGKKSRKPKQSD